MAITVKIGTWISRMSTNLTNSYDRSYWPSPFEHKLNFEQMYGVKVKVDHMHRWAAIEFADELQVLKWVN